MELLSCPTSLLFCEQQVQLSWYHCIYHIVSLEHHQYGKYFLSLACIRKLNFAQSNSFSWLQIGLFQNQFTFRNLLYPKFWIERGWVTFNNILLNKLGLKKKTLESWFCFYWFFFTPNRLHNLPASSLPTNKRRMLNFTSNCHFRLLCATWILWNAFVQC